MNTRAAGILSVLGLSASPLPAHSQGSMCMWDRYCGCPSYDAAAETAEEARVRVGAIAAVLKATKDPQERTRVSKAAQRAVSREFADGATRKHLLCFLEARGLLSREATLEAVAMLAVDEPKDGPSHHWEHVGTASFQSSAPQLRPYQIRDGPFVHVRRFGFERDSDESDSQPWMKLTIETREYTLGNGDAEVHKANRWTYQLCGDEIKYPPLALPPPSGRLIIHRCPRGATCDWEAPNPCH